MGLLVLLALVLGTLVVFWALLALVALRHRRAVRDIAKAAASCSAAVRRLLRDPRVPRRVKMALGFALLWVVSPIDLVPEFLPVIGLLDDVVVVLLALRYASRHVPRPVLEEAFAGDTSLLDRLIVKAN